MATQGDTTGTIDFSQYSVVRDDKTTKKAKAAPTTPAAPSTTTSGPNLPKTPSIIEFSSYVHPKKGDDDVPLTDDQFYSRLPWYGRALSSIESGFGIQRSTQFRPSEWVKGPWEAIKHPSLEWNSLKQMYMSMNDAQQDVIDRAFALQHMPGAMNKANGFAMGVFAAIPLFGPALVHAQDQWNSGDHAGGAASFGTVFAQFLLPEAADRVANSHPVEFLRNVASKVPAPSMTEIMQKAADTGPKMTEALTMDELTKLKEENATLADKYKSDLSAYDEKVRRINEDTDHAIEKIKQDKSLQEADRVREIEAAERQHALDVRKTYEDWVQKTAVARKQARGTGALTETGESKAVPKTQVEIEQQHTRLKQQQEKFTTDVQQNVEQTQKNVERDFNQRWEQNREAVGGDTPAPVQPIADEIEEARKNLGGVPSDLSVFNQVMKDITDPAENLDTAEGAKPMAKESIPYDRMRKQYTALSQTAYRMPTGAPKAALLKVLKVYDDILTKMNEEAGQGKVYSQLKADWHDYMTDWHDMSSLSTGPSRLRTPQPGSPLARLYRMVDPENIRKTVADKTYSDRLLETYGRYKKFGADPQLLAKLRGSIRAEANLPKTPPKPTGLEPAPGTKLQVLPKPKLPEKPAEPAPIDTASFDRKIMEQEYLRRKKIERVEQPVTPQPKPIPTVEQMVETVRKAKVERAADYASTAGKPRAYDWIAATYVLQDFIRDGWEAAATHAALYVGTRFSWRVLVKSKPGMEWMTRMTVADVDSILKVYDKDPATQAEAARAITEGLIDNAKQTGPKPNLTIFEKLLSKSQMAQVIKARIDAQRKSGKVVETQQVAVGQTVDNPTNEDVYAKQARQELGPKADARAVLRRAQELKLLNQNYGEFPANPFKDYKKR